MDDQWLWQLLAVLLFGALVLWLLRLNGSSTKAEQLSQESSAAGLDLPIEKIEPLLIPEAIDQAKGKIGELLTAIILISDGWRQIQSAYDNTGHGVDGLFVRPAQGGGWRVLIVETKTNTSPFKAEQISNEWIKDRLDRRFVLLPPGPEQTALEKIIQAIDAMDGRIEKQLWRHRLDEGVTNIHSVDGDTLLPATSHSQHAPYYEAIRINLDPPRIGWSGGGSP